MSTPDKPLEKYTVEQLKEMLRKDGIPLTGLKLKADFIKKLSEHQSKSARTPTVKQTQESGPSRASAPKPPSGASSSTKVDLTAKMEKFFTAVKSAKSKTQLKNILKDLSPEDKEKVVQFVNPTDGSTALHWAVRNNDTEATELLLENGAKIEAVAKDGGTPLHWGAYDGKHADAVEILIEKGANLEAHNKEGDTPLLVALTKSVEDDVEIYQRMKDERGNKNLFQFEVAEALLKAGAKALPVKLYKKSAYKHPLLFHFIHYRGVNTYQYNKVAYILIEYDTDKTHLEEINYDKTPLMEAAETENLEVIKMLLNQGVNINKEIRKHNNPIPYTAYVYAIYKGNVEICKFLLDHGAEQTIKYVNQLKFSYQMADIMKERIKRLVDAGLLKPPPKQFVLITDLEKLKELCEKNKEEDGTYTCAITGEPLEPNESIAIQTENGNSQCYKKENLLRWINRGIVPTLNPLTNKAFTANELQELRQKLTQAGGKKGKKKTTANAKAKAKKRRS